MIKTGLQIYLASGSPRRKKLLKQLNIDFRSFSVDCSEEIKAGEKPESIVKRIAGEKLGLALEKIKEGIIITADTIVVIDGHVLGKPENENDGERILKKLSGRTHTVYTGFAVFNSENERTIVDYEKTDVTFRKLSSEEIRDYIKSGSPMDKAGAYGIQDDFGAVFVTGINGCYYNVVGLPLSKVYSALCRITEVA